MARQLGSLLALGLVLVGVALLSNALLRRLPGPVPRQCLLQLQAPAGQPGLAAPAPQACELDTAASVWERSGCLRLEAVCVYQERLILYQDKYQGLPRLTPEGGLPA